MKEISWHRLIALDERGIFPRDGEDADAFFQRVDEADRADLPEDDFPDAPVIPPEIIAEGGDLTEKFFAFRRLGDRGFFLSRGVGWLWGGCAVTDPETGKGFFLLRDSFAKRKKWFCYRRDELLGHELCHIARAVLDDPSLEEYFAYRTSYSRLRRAIGDVFTSTWDAALFLTATLLLPAASIARILWLPSLAIGYFYAFLGGVLLFFTIRSFARRRIVCRARRNLAKFGIGKPDALLFRSTKKEIAEIAALADGTAWKNWFAGKRRQLLRWEIIARRFCA